jgi:L-alanine-DL-glutamate epimerase-like enolase superfamily enzyme
VIQGLAPAIIGKDPRAVEAHVALMQAIRRVAAGGLAQQAIGAIENALVDIKAKALGVPVYELLGGPIRDTIRLYWSHCGSYRVGKRADYFNAPPHNVYSPLATTISTHFSAAVPNLRIMEIDPDVVPWYYELVTVPPRIENSYVKIPTGPGWGTDVNEEVVRAHPPRSS